MKQHPNYFNESGMTLLEILVTVFVLAVGLLGLAGLQSSSIKGGMDVSQRSQALWLANDLADRMRANPDAMNDYNSFDTQNCGGAPNNCSDYGNNSNGSSCTPAQTAAFDVWEVACGQPAAANVLTNPVDSMDITAVNVSCAVASCTNLNSAVYNVVIVYNSKLVNSSKGIANRAAQESQSVSIRVVPTYVPEPI